VPVIVLSATLPARRREAVIHAYMGRSSTPEPVSDPLGRSTHIPSQPQAWASSREYPLITCTDGNEVKPRAIPIYGAPREVRLEYLSDNALPDRLDDLLLGGGCAGVIVNTVNRAQETAKALSERFGEETVRLLHSRFLAPDRAQKELELLKELGSPAKKCRRPEKRIVVGTQVLEQSLDIDFDVLVTDICPMDLLLQRIGRLHRHERTRPEKLGAALCLITGVDGDDFEPGARAVYYEYPLMRTKALLPPRLTLPQSISDLVQDAYDETLDIVPEPPGYREAKERWGKVLSDKEKRAEDFRICPPWSGPAMNLVGWLNTDVPASDKHGEAAVRDTDESIEVLLVQERDGGRLCFLPWIEKGREIPQNETPCDELARTLACQSIRLPRTLCAPWKICKTIDTLETLNGQRLSEWQKSPWLKGELFLILDENCSTNLCGYRLKYDINYGLLCEKEGETDA
jgi:CRISPR-associated endonuclease/helicase Cas3